jgi:hypothetical protein
MTHEGAVFIIDPNGDTHVPSEFPNLIARIRVAKALKLFTTEELRRLVGEIEYRLRRENGSALH